MRRAFFCLALIAAFASCSSEPEVAAAPAADSLTRRQKDSIYAASKMPHAGAVGRALGAAGAAAGAAAAHDALLR